MTLSINPEHLKRYKDVARLFFKYGRSDVIQQAGWSELLEDGLRAGRDEHAAAAVNKGRELAEDLERLGPTFIKVGQVLSTRADLLPQPYLDALGKLQDHIEPFAFEDVERIIVEELGVKLRRAFSEFDPAPLAAASLGQVHRAALRDGRPVAVKVQRPDIRPRIAADLDALEEIAGFLDAHTEVGRRYEFTRILAELRKTLLAELDYRQEARHMAALRENLRDFQRILIPAPIDDYTSSRVLTMDFMHGRKLTDLSPVVLIELEGRALAEELSRAYLKQILVDGFFHADPHPGNVHISDDHRLILLDVGMVARLPPRMQDSLTKMLLAISEGRGEDAARVALDLGEQKDGFDAIAFQHRAADFVARHHDARLQDIQTGRVVIEFHAVAAETGLRLPQEFTMIGKALLNLDAITRTLDPEFNPNASIRRNAADVLQQRMRRNLSPGNLFNSILELSEFTQRLPDRLNRLLELLAGNQMKLNVDAIDEDRLIHGLQKIANRIATGLILAALIVGAAIIMQIDTSFKIFGYPGLAILLFLGAAIGGVALVISILHNDR